MLFNLALSSWAFVVSSLILRLLFFGFSISKRVSGDDTGGECFLEVPASDLPAVFVEVFFVLEFLIGDCGCGSTDLGHFGFNQSK